MELGIQKKNKLESKIQSEVIAIMEAQGFFVVKLIKTNKNGIPDLLCMRKDEYFFIEVKSAKGKLSKIQEYRIKELQTFDIKTFVI
jgi:Holliday junction resolvase